MRAVGTDEELELSGSREELLALRDDLMHFAQDSAATDLRIALDDSGDPAPYDQAFRNLTFTKAEGKLVFVARTHQLHISGSASGIENLAENLPWDAEAPAAGIDYHVHYDSIGHGDYVSESSADLVIRLDRDGNAESGRRE